MNTAVHQIQRLVELGRLPRGQARVLIDELEAVQFRIRKPGSLRHLRAQYLCGRLPAETYRTAVRVSRVGYGVTVMLGLIGVALFLCLRDPGAVPSRDMALPSVLAMVMGLLTTTILHYARRGEDGLDAERRRALESD